MNEREVDSRRKATLTTIGRMYKIGDGEIKRLIKPHMDAYYNEWKEAIRLRPENHRLIHAMDSVFEDKYRTLFSEIENLTANRQATLLISHWKRKRRKLEELDNYLWNLVGTSI